MNKMISDEFPNEFSTQEKNLAFIDNSLVLPENAHQKPCNDILTEYTVEIFTHKIIIPIPRV